VVYDLSVVLLTGIHVIMPRTGSRLKDGIQLHTNNSEIDEITRRKGVPITTHSRPIVVVIADGLGRDRARQVVERQLEKDG
jgi:hypothetical protein